MYSNSYLNTNKMTKHTFDKGTKNDSIFNTTAPYRNPYQGTAPRWLFVCSAGLLRSPTGATMAAQRGINARSCGSSIEYALVPCSANLVSWADSIVFVSEENLWQLEKVFQKHPEILEQIHQKAIVLNIPDNFDYMNPQLQQIFQEELFQLYGPGAQ